MLHQKQSARCGHTGPAATSRRAHELNGASYQAGGKQPTQRGSGGGGNGVGYPEGDKQRQRVRRPGRPGIGASRESKASSYQQVRAPAGVGTSLAAGGEGWQAPQPSWSCWQPARAAASHPACAAKRPHIPRHICVWGAAAAAAVWAATTQATHHSTPGARQPQPGRGRNLHGTGWGMSQQCRQPGKAPAGRGQGRGGAGPQE